MEGIDNNYYIEETTKNLDLINLNLYAVLIIIDAEKSYSEEEIIAIQNSLENEDLGILIISEWNNDLDKKQKQKKKKKKQKKIKK